NCKEMARAAIQYKKHCATGHQRHYNVLYDHAIKLLQSGVMGDLHYIRAQWHRNNQPGKDSWQPPLPKAAKENDPQADRLEKELVSWTRTRDTLLADIEKIAGNTKMSEALKTARTGALRKDVALWNVKIAQKKAQLDDAVLVAGGEWEGLKLKSAKEYGYVDDPNFMIEGEKKAYDRPALEELIRWRLFDRTSAGLMAELGSHQLDAASIFIAAIHGGVKQLPISVSCSSIRSLFPVDLETTPLDRNADDHIHCVFDYPAPGYDPNHKMSRLQRITVAYSSINGNGFGGYGEVVYGTKGTLLIDREKEASFYRGAAIEDKTIIVKNDQGELDVQLSESGDPLSRAIGLQATFGDVSRGYCEELEHWAYCIRDNPEPTYSDEELHDPEKKKRYPRCYPAVALNDAVIALTTNIAGDLGETILFDPAWFDYKNDATPEAHFAENEDARKEFTPSLERPMYQ
ncbi:MAG TPA: hypothetical protein DEB39_09690, partial [Planctomycetaceae bacterium]|nr:hypothetical protein [Planctomycetaceae bacterium]